MRILIILLLLFNTNLFAMSINEAVKIALKNNFSLKSKEYLLKSSKFKLKSAEALKMPSFFIDSSYTDLNASKKDSFDTPFGSISFKIREKNYFNITTGIKWNVYTGGYVSENIEAAKSEISELKNDVLEQKLDVIFRTKITYLNILTLKAYEKIAESHLIALNNHLKDVKNFYNQGLVAYVDILQTEVKVKEAEQLLTKIRNNIKVAKTNLAIILGLNPDEKIIVEPLRYNINQKFCLQKLYTIAENKRPVLKKIKAQIEKLNHAIGIARSQYKPKIYVAGGYQYSDESDSIENKGGYFIKGGLKFNLDWTKAFHDVDSLKQKKVSLKFIFEDIKSQIFLQVKKSYQDYLTSLKNFDVSQSTVKTASEYFRIMKLKYNKGLADNTDLLDAEAMLTKAKMEEKTNYYNVIAKIFEIERAIGKHGGEDEK